MTSGAYDAAPVACHRSRPGAAAMLPRCPARWRRSFPGIWCSPGLSNVYLLPTTAGRVIINAGMGFEGPVHRREPRLRRHRTGALPHRHPGALRPRRRPGQRARPRHRGGGPGELAAVARRQRATGPLPGRPKRIRVLRHLAAGIARIRSSAGSCRARAPLLRTSLSRHLTLKLGERAGTDRHAGRGATGFDGALAARRADVSVRQRLRHCSVTSRTW